MNIKLLIKYLLCIGWMFCGIVTSYGQYKANSKAVDYSILPESSITNNNRGGKRVPIITLIGPNGAIKNASTIKTKQEEIVLRGSITSLKPIKLMTINQKDRVFLEPNGNFKVRFSASLANNNYTIEVTDKDDYKSKLTFNIKNTAKTQVVARSAGDKTAPVIKLTSPAAARGITSEVARGLKKKKVYKVNKDKVEIAGEIIELSGIKSLTINGQALSLVNNKQFQYIYKLTAQKTEITIKAIDINDNTSVLKFILEKTSQAINPNESNLYVVSIGISNFRKQEYNLVYADDDAKGMHKTFTIPENKKLFKNIYSKLLVNEQATRAGIIKSFQWLRKNATAKDLVVLFIASHGFNEDNNFYILPHDGDPDELLITGVNWSALAITLSRLACRKMVFVDACHSAQLGEDLVKKRGSSISDIRKAQQILKRKEYGTVLFSAASKAESSLEAPKWKHGAFTLAVMEALQGKADKNGDGIVYLSELNLYTLERVKELTEGKQHPSLQNPASITQLPLCIVK